MEIERKDFLVEIEKADKDKGTFTAIISDESIDRMGERIKIDGWNLTEYEKNPVILWNHNRNAPIGTSKVWKSHKRLKAKAMIDLKAPTEKWPSDVPHPTLVNYWIQNDIVRMTSIGALKLEEPIYEETKKGTIVTYPSVELVEWSVVPVPSNRNAKIIAKDFDITEKQAEQWFDTEEKESEVDPKILDLLEKRIKKLEDDIKEKPEHYFPYLFSLDGDIEIDFEIEDDNNPDIDLSVEDD